VLINLPQLAAGWKYEGWAVFNNGNSPATIDQFTRATGVDSSSPYSGNEPAPLFPGEDFLFNLPAGIDGIVTGLPVVISIEPYLVGDPNIPFFLKPISETEGINGNALSVKSNINATINGTAVRYKNRNTQIKKLQYCTGVFLYIYVSSYFFMRLQKV